MTNMARRSTVSALLLALLAGLGWYGATRAVAQQPPTMPWLTVACSFADAVSSGDLNQVAAHTTPEYQAFLVAQLNGQPLGCGLTGRGFIQNGSRLSDTYASVQLVCRHPSGVEEIVVVAVRLTDGAWKVSGGYKP